MADVSVTREIAAPAERVWSMVSDLTRMGEWSPEADGGEWRGGADGPSPGAKFRGRNRNGSRRWTTAVTVVDADPGRRFTFRVDAAVIPVAEWGFELEPTDGGCQVTEFWSDRRPGFFRPIARLATGVADRASHNRTTMERTLERLAAAAEAGD